MKVELNYYRSQSKNKKQCLFFRRLIYLCCLGVFGGIIIPTHAQHILCTVVELREAIKLAVVVAYHWLIDAAEGGLGVVGAVEERLEN